MDAFFSQVNCATWSTVQHYDRGWNEIGRIGMRFEWIEYVCRQREGEREREREREGGGERGETYDCQ